MEKEGGGGEEINKRTRLIPRHLRRLVGKWAVDTQLQDRSAATIERGGPGIA